jgi:hypothetical protein
MHYRALIVEEDPPVAAREAIEVLGRAGRVIRWTDAMDDKALLRRIDTLVPRDAAVTPDTADLRIRHVRKDGLDYYLLFNEGGREVTCRIALATEGRRILLDPFTAASRSVADDDMLSIPGYAMRVLSIRDA